MSSSLGISDVLARNPVVGDPKRAARRFWTTTEIRILGENWSRGLDACLPLLPGRTAAAIYAQARIRKLPGPEQTRRGIPRQRWRSSDHIDDVIRRRYPDAASRREVQRLADGIGRPGWWVTKRAVTLGLARPAFKELRWSDAEDDVLAASATLHPATIRRRILAACGVARTPTAIVVRLKRRHLSRVDPVRMSATALAAMFGVDAHTVRTMIDHGLPAARAGTARTPQQGGDEWVIHRRPLRDWIAENPLSVDLRKVDPVWFIDLLVSP